MYFLITAFDGKGEDVPARRAEVRPRHLANLKALKGEARIMCAGAVRDDDGKVTGSYLVMDFEDRDQLDEYLSGEPYILEKVWEKVKVENCAVVFLNDELVE